MPRGCIAKRVVQWADVVVLYVENTALRLCEMKSRELGSGEGTPAEMRVSATGPELEAGLRGLMSVGFLLEPS